METGAFIPTMRATPCRSFWSNKTAIERCSCSSRERNCTCDNSSPKIGTSIGTRLRETVSLSEYDSFTLSESDANSLHDWLVAARAYIHSQKPHARFLPQ